MKKISVLLFLLLQSIVGFSQTNIHTQKGYIITSTHDTIHGEIMEHPYTYLSNKVKFTQTNSDKTIEYTPKNLFGFQIEPDKVFEVITVKEKVKRDTIETKYFALKAVKGEVELLVLTLNSGKERFFINSSDFGIKELSQNIKIDDGKKSTDNKYKIELGKYFYEYPNFQRKINETNFHYQSLSRIINEYNLNFEKPSSIIKEKKVKWHLIANVGIDYYLGEKIENDNNATGMVFGLKNFFYKNEKNLKMEFVIGVAYRYYSYNDPLKVQKITDTLSVIEFPIGPPSYTFEYSDEVLDFKFSANILEMPIYFEYNNKLNFVSPIIQAGIKPYLIQEKIRLTNYSMEGKDNWKFTSDFILGLGLGINYKRLSFKYIIYAEPLLQNSFNIEFMIN